MTFRAKEIAAPCIKCGDIACDVDDVVRAYNFAPVLDSMNERLLLDSAVLAVLACHKRYDRRVK